MPYEHLTLPELARDLAQASAGRDARQRSGSAMMPETWTPGDVGYYVLPKSAANGRDCDLYLAITVINVTPTRVVVRPRDGRGGHRIIKAHSLVEVAPQGAWVR